MISELSTAIILYTGKTKTLTVAIYTEVIRGNYGTAAALSTIMTIRPSSPAGLQQAQWRKGYQSLSNPPVLLRALSFQTGLFLSNADSPNGKMRQASRRWVACLILFKLDAWGLQTFAFPSIPSLVKI